VDAPLIRIGPEADGGYLIPDDLDEVHFTEGLHDRKLLMDRLSDAFVVLPGGLGTLDELFDCLAPKSLHKHQAPIVILDYQNYFEYLFRFLDHMIREQFALEEHRQLWFRAENISAAFQYLETYQPPFPFDDLWPDRARTV
ncbi:MAG: LOG family protein, partial [Lentisphaerae bacterium]